MDELKFHKCNTDHFDHTSILIPVDLCSYVQSAHLVNPFELFLYFKLKFSGNFHFTQENREQICSDLVITDRTLRNRFKRLLEMDWVGYSEAKGVVWIRSMSHVCGKIGQCRRRCAVYRVPIHLDKVNKKGKYSWGQYVKAFVAGVAQLTREVKKERKAEAYQGKSRAHHPSTSPSQHANNITNISKSTNLRMRKLASDYGFIKVSEYSPKKEELFKLNATELQYLNGIGKGWTVRLHRPSGKFYERRPAIIRNGKLEFRKRRSFAGKN